VGGKLSAAIDTDLADDQGGLFDNPVIQARHRRCTTWVAISARKITHPTTPKKVAPEESHHTAPKQGKDVRMP
jgi:hypothetical protein